MLPGEHEARRGGTPRRSADERGECLRGGEIRAVILESVADLTGLEVERLDTSRNVFEMGLDSRVLFKVSQNLERRFGVLIAMTAFHEQASTIDGMVEYVESALPPVVEAPVETPAAAAPVPVQASTPVASPAASQVERLMAQQLQIMEQQLALLRQVHGGGHRHHRPRPPRPRLRPCLRPCPP